MRGGGRGSTVRKRSASWDSTPDAMMNDNNQPSSRYNRLFAVLIAAKPTATDRMTTILPSRVKLSRRGGRKRRNRRDVRDHNDMSRRDRHAPEDLTDESLAV